jgi:MFS family permease
MLSGSGQPADGICFGRANDMGLLLAFRFLQGCMGSTGSTMVGGTLADIWPTSEYVFSTLLDEAISHRTPHRRGTKMSLLTFVCFFGNST